MINKNQRRYMCIVFDILHYILLLFFILMINIMLLINFVNYT